MFAQNTQLQIFKLKSPRLHNMLPLRCLLPAAAITHSTLVLTTLRPALTFNTLLLLHWPYTSPSLLSLFGLGVTRSIWALP